MKALTDQRDALRFWALGACAVLLSAASAFTFLIYIGQGIVVGDLLGLRGREAHVATAQRWAIFWLVVSGSCFAGSSVTAALTSAIDPEEPRLPRFVASQRMAQDSHSQIVGCCGPCQVMRCRKKIHFPPQKVLTDERFSRSRQSLIYRVQCTFLSIRYLSAT